MSSFRVLLDLNRCQGYANCVIAAPAIFDIDEQSGQAKLLQAAPDANEREAAQEAVRQCPTEAISLDP